MIVGCHSGVIPYDAACHLGLLQAKLARLSLPSPPNRAHAARIPGVSDSSASTADARRTRSDRQ